MAEYTPRSLGGDFKDPDLIRVVNWVIAELRTIGTALLSVDQIELVKLHVEPSKPRVGMIVYADGTDWNPGSGVGFYGHSGSAWVFLG